MFRKVIASLLFLILGLYVSAATVPIFVCLGGPVDTPEQSCCDEAPPCGGDTKEANNCCGNDSECCVVSPKAPDGLEPAPIRLPNPVLVPVALVESDHSDILPAEVSFTDHRPIRPPPPSRQAMTRYVFGVWRL